VADQRLARVPQKLKVREDLVEDALRAYGNLMKSRPTDATVPLEMARVYQTAGNIYRLGNKFEKARAQFEVARRLVDNLGAGNPKNPEYRELTGELLRENAVLEWTMGRPADAVPLARSALDIALALRADFPKELPYERMEARLRSLVGLLAREFGRYGEALAELDKSIELWKHLADGPAVGPTDGVELVIALDGRGAALIETNRTVEAAEVLRQAINRSRVLLLRAPDDPDRRSVLASALTNLGRVLATDPAKSTEATKALDEAVDLSKNLVIDFPEVVQNRASLAEKLEARATLDTQESREPAAQQDVQEATRLLDRLLQQFPDASDYNELLARTLVDQAILARKAGRSGEVPGLLDRAKLCLERARKANPEGLLIKRTWATYQAERARIAEPGAPSRLKP
jgi:tetratricopeptide (TPR) repeat protein